MQNSQQAIADSSTKLQKLETTISLDNSRPGRSGLDELVPSRYALKVARQIICICHKGIRCSVIAGTTDSCEMLRSK
jgi:hypothetical protein